jgi:hypothetical protein
MLLAQTILVVGGVYAAAGVLFAVAFVTSGVGRIDPVAVGAGIGFRVLILPGVAALWPVMLLIWVRR